METKGSAKALLAGMGALRSKLELDRNDEGFTTYEYMEKFGLSYDIARVELRRLTETGELIKGLARKVDARGINRRINVYRAAK